MAELLHTQALLAGAVREPPDRQLVLLLRATNELIALPDNDFSWSSWGDAITASAEIAGLLLKAESGHITEADIAFIYAPTGPLQELSLSSGWAETFLKVAERYDSIAAKLWSRSSS